MKKKLLIIGLCVLLLFSSISGCGKSATEKEDTKVKESKQTEKQNTDKKDKDDNGYITELPDGEKLTAWVTINSSVYGASVEDIYYYNKVSENLGIDIEFMSGEPEQLSILAASYDLPDIVEVNSNGISGNGVNKDLSSGLIIPINDLMDAGFTPNLLKTFQQIPEAEHLSKTDDGTFYMFPMIRGIGSPRVFTGSFIRKDWLDELGLELPKTIDDWQNVLTAFKEQKGAKAPLSTQWIAYDILFSGSFGINISQTNGHYMVKEDNVVKYGPIEPGMKQYLDYMRNWYTNGLLDPDIFSPNNDTLMANITTNNVGAYAGWPSSLNRIEQLKNDNPEIEFVAASLPTLEEGQEHLKDWMAPAVASFYYTITENSKYPAIAAKFCDYPYSEEGHMLANFGEEGKTYNMIDGYPTFTDFALKNEDGYGFQQIVDHYMGGQNKPYIVSKEFQAQSQGLQQQRDALSLWEQENGKYMKDIPLVSLTDEENSEYASLMNEIKIVVDEYKMKYIMGMEEEDSFDNFVNTLKNMGIDRATEIQQDAVDRFNAR